MMLGLICRSTMVLRDSTHLIYSNKAKDAQKLVATIIGLMIRDRNGAGQMLVEKKDEIHRCQFPVRS